jgi:hypothetical protein
MTLTSNPNQSEVRIINRIIRNSFNKHATAAGCSNISLLDYQTYNDRRKGFRRRCAKSWGAKFHQDRQSCISVIPIWESVLEDLEEAGIKGWEMYSGCGTPSVGIKSYQNL